MARESSNPINLEGYYSKNFTKECPIHNIYAQLLALLVLVLHFSPVLFVHATLISYTKTIMPPNFHVPFTILFFFLSITSCLNIVFSEPLTRDYMNFNTWISWHVQRHKEKSAAATQKTSVASNWKHRLAELDRMELTVSQDGSGDFITITEAVKNIPLGNTRRVVIRLSSGVYRYVNYCMRFHVT